MKKIICIILALCTLFMCACGSESETYTTEEKIQIADQIIYENLGDLVLETDYDDGMYYVLFTFDGATTGYGSAEFIELCDAVDTLSKTLNEAGIDNVIIFASDLSYDIPLYITHNGKDITDIYYS